MFCGKMILIVEWDGVDMERERRVKIILIVVICSIFFCLSLGFSAYSKRISVGGTASVVTADDMVILFASENSLSGNTVVANPVSAVPIQYDMISGVQVEHKASIDNSNTSTPRISGLKAYFSNVNQTVTYSFYVYNSWNSPAYLNSITFNSSKSCNAIEGGLSSDPTIQATQLSQINDACSGITLSVKVGNDASVTSTSNNISGHSLSSRSFEPVVVTITYGANSTIADIDFSVSFGSITLNYGSTD